jgi:flagellar hook-associated protein 2
MAITAAGVGSGLDIESIVRQLMTLERQPLVAKQRQESATNAQLSSYGKIKSAISSFQDAMQELSTADKFKVFSATSSDEDVITAETSSQAAAGVYSLTVNRIAQNHKQGSDEFADTLTFGGTSGDQLTLTVGSDSVDVDLSTAKTLSEVRDAINSNADNPGVTATILNTGGGNQRLILTADESGYEDRVQLAYGGTLDATTFNFSTTNQSGGAAMVDLTELDASFNLDGFDLTSASNSVSEVMDGITFNLKQTGSANLQVERDTEAIEESVQSFVDAYNAVLDEVNSQYQGNLSGDASLRSIRNRMRDVLNTQPVGLSGTFTSLAQVGIKTDAFSGRLEFDSSDLSDALDTDFAGVAELFSNDDQGYAFRYDALAESFLDNDGVISSREDTLNDRIRGLQDDQADIERRLDLKEKSLRSQYAALDSLIGSLQSSSAFLFQQISSQN